LIVRNVKQIVSFCFRALRNLKIPFECHPNVFLLVFRDPEV
jgi:hypothetical protein